MGLRRLFYQLWARMRTEGPIFRLTRLLSSSNSSGSLRRRVRRSSRLDIKLIITVQINAFYLQKEAGLQLRLETLLSKRRAAAMRVLPVFGDDDTRDHVEWNAVEEGLRLLERDLGKLQAGLTSLVLLHACSNQTVL
jgi:hypothetical protein